MPILTSHRCFSGDPDCSWYYIVEDSTSDYPDQPGHGLTIKYYTANTLETELDIPLEETLLIRDAINQLYPLDKYKAL